MSCTNNNFEVKKYPKNNQTFTAAGIPTSPAVNTPLYTIPDLESVADLTTGLSKYTNRVLNDCCPCPKIVAYDVKCSNPEIETTRYSVTVEDCFMSYCEQSNIQREINASLKVIAAKP